MDECPLGSGALTATTYPIDREATAKALGFARITQNSLDGVSDRDFVIELESDLSILMMHLSRFSEEICLWCSWEFKFVELDDAFATGSSIMELTLAGAATWFFGVARTPRELTGSEAGEKRQTVGLLFLFACLLMAVTPVMVLNVVSVGRLLALLIVLTAAFKGGMKLILRFLKPTRGSVTTDAVRVGYVPQRTGDRNTGFPITVREMLNSYRNILKIKDKSVIDCSLAQVGLPDKADALMGSLSGGQSQRALIARALMASSSPSVCRVCSMCAIVSS